MDCVIHLTYFPNISHLVAMVNADQVIMEVFDNYQKQTYRNRTEIYAANGKLTLTVPVIYSQTNRQLYRDVRIASTENWQQTHLKSLQSAYSMSPFFEYYIDDLMPLFEKHFNFLIDLNWHCLETLQTIFPLEFSLKRTGRYDKSPQNCRDGRHLVLKKQKTMDFAPYAQVYTHKHGFIPNLSALDLLFNEGPASDIYLRRQDLNQCYK